MAGASLFDTDEGVAARDDAISNAEANANDRWFAAALAAVGVIAARGEPFTTDRVWALLARMGVDTHERRAMGPVMLAARRAGIVEATDEFRASVRAEHHCGPVRVWVSTRVDR